MPVFLAASRRTADHKFNSHSGLGRALPLFVAAALSIGGFAGAVVAAEPMDARVAALVPELEATIASGMKAFDNPGLAIGIVTSDRLVYAKGFGVRKKGGEPVDAATVFQIGSATKSFLATTMAITADRKKFAWDDRVVDLDPDFQMKDPWVTREFRVFDLIAQRSGLPPYANDMVGLLGGDQQAMVHSLRFVEPVSSFRSTFAYTNITHILAQRIVAKQLGAKDWDAVVRAEIFAPLGMKDSSLTAEAIEAAANRSWGYRWTPDGTVEIPFTPAFPYGFGAAGAINSNVDDMARWLRLQLGNGVFEGKRLISAENLDFIRTPKVGVSDTISYALGWAIRATPNGRVIWHSGATDSFGAYAGFLPDKDVGVVVLTNESNVGFPDAIGEWVFDRLINNPVVDNVAVRLSGAKARFETGEKLFAKPGNPRPFPAVAPLAGDFTSPIFGGVSVKEDGGALAVEFKATGAKNEARALGRGDLYRHVGARGPVCGNSRKSRPETARLRPVPDGPNRQARHLPLLHRRRPGVPVPAGVAAVTVGTRRRTRAEPALQARVHQMDVRAKDSATIAYRGGSGSTHHERAISHQAQP
jgi:CubicO group peptidase (beta-lactamase class C family)